MTVEIIEKRGKRNIIVNGKPIGYITLNEELTTLESTKIIETIEAKDKRRSTTKKAYEDKYVTKIEINEGRSIISIHLDDDNTIKINLARGTIGTTNGIITKSYIAKVQGKLKHLLDSVCEASKEDKKYIYKLMYLSHHTFGESRIGLALSRIENKDIKLAEVFMDITDGLIKTNSEIGYVYEVIDVKKITDKNKYSVLKLLGVSKEEMLDACKSEMDTDDAIKIIRKHRDVLRLAKEEYPELVMRLTKTHRFRDTDGPPAIDYELVDALADLIKGNKLKTRDVFNYFAHSLAAQGYLPERIMVSRAPFSTYSDYLNMAKDSMERKKIDFFPRSLLTAHQILTTNIKIKLNQEMLDKLSALELSKYEFKTKQYSIIAPKHPTDIVKEGNELSHCVASFVSKVVEGYTVIVFLREAGKEDTSFYTVEVRNNIAVQTLGHSNKDATPEVRDFIDRYNTFLRKKDNEDKKRQRTNG